MVISKLSEAYWANRYVGAKRVASFAAEEVKEAAIDFTVYASRGEVALQLAKALNLDTSDKNSSFADIKPTSKYAGATTALHKLGIFSGDSEGKFNPSSPLTREQLAKVLVLAFDLTPGENELTFKDVPVNHPSAKFISILASHGITTGVGHGLFGVKEYVTLTQLQAFIDRAQNS